MIVVDTNIVVAFALPGVRREDALALALSDPDWACPKLCRSEFRNVLIGYVRRGDCTLENAFAMEREVQTRLGDSNYHPDSRSILELAHTSGCTTYDCEFVALALQLGVPLVTLDKQVLKAFPEIAFPLPSLN